MKIIFHTNSKYLSYCQMDFNRICFKNDDIATEIVRVMLSGFNSSLFLSLLITVSSALMHPTNQPFICSSTNLLLCYRGSGELETVYVYAVETVVSYKMVCVYVTEAVLLNYIGLLFMFTLY